jgi:hypothetical protein
MERGQTLFLKVTVVLLSLPVLSLCILWLPDVAADSVVHFPRWMAWPVIIGMYASAIPYFIALYQAFGLLNLIDRNDAFSEHSVKALMWIKQCAASITVLYLAMSPLLYLMAERDDAPGILAFGLGIAFGSAVVAVFAAVLQKLLRSAIDMKQEIDLTV